MIAVDTNVLVHAHREESPKHGAARKRLAALAEGRARWAMPVFCLGEFLRVITHPRVYSPPFTVREAREASRRFLASPGLEILRPGPEFEDLLLEAMVEADASGNLVFDAQIVAVCRESGVARILTEDRDFDRFDHIEVIRL